MRRMKEEYKKTKMHNWWFLQGLSCWGLCTLCSFSKVLEGFGAFFYSSPRDSSNLMPALFCLPRFYCVTFLHFLFGYKMSYAIFILFLCSFLGYVMHDYLFTDFYQFLAWKFQYSLACFRFCQCWRWRLCGFCDSIVSLIWDLGTMVERERERTVL